MNEINQEDHPHAHVKKGACAAQATVLEAAHHDWKFWVALIAMLLAMAVYLRSNDLSLRPNHATPQQPVP